MTASEGDVLIGAFGTGDHVVTETAWYARQVFARHPIEALEYPIPPEARLEMFVDGTTIPAEAQDIACKVLNRPWPLPNTSRTTPSWTTSNPTS